MFESIKNFFAANWKKLLLSLVAAIVSFFVLQFVVAPFLGVFVVSIVAALLVGFVIWSRVSATDIEILEEKVGNQKDKEDKKDKKDKADKVK